MWGTWPLCKRVLPTSLQVRIKIFKAKFWLSFLAREDDQEAALALIPIGDQTTEDTKDDHHPTVAMREVQNLTIIRREEGIIEALIPMSHVTPNITAVMEEIAQFPRMIDAITPKESVEWDKDRESTNYQNEIRDIVVTKTEVTAKSIEVLINELSAPFLLVPSDSLLNFLSSSYNLPKFAIIFNSVESFLNSFNIFS